MHGETQLLPLSRPAEEGPDRRSLPDSSEEATPAWVALSPPETPAGDDLAALTSSATRRRYLQRRLFRAPVSGVAGGLVEPMPTAGPDGN